MLPRCKHGLCCAERWRIKQHQGAAALLLHLLLFPSAIIGTCHYWMSYSCWVVLCINFCLCIFGPFSFKWYKMWHISLSFSTVHKTPFHYTSSFLNWLCKFLIWVENQSLISGSFQCLQYCKWIKQVTCLLLGSLDQNPNPIYSEWGIINLEHIEINLWINIVESILLISI